MGTSLVLAETFLSSPETSLGTSLVLAETFLSSLGTSLETSLVLAETFSASLETSLETFLLSSETFSSLPTESFPFGDASGSLPEGSSECLPGGSTESLSSEDSPSGSSLAGSFPSGSFASESFSVKVFPSVVLSGTAVESFGTERLLEPGYLCATGRLSLKVPEGAGGTGTLAGSCAMSLEFFCLFTRCLFTWLEVAGIVAEVSRLLNLI